MTSTSETPPPVVTLTTDFGTLDHYVAVMKGQILSICPKATLVDVTHEVPAQSVGGGSFIVEQMWSWFPPGTVHVVVVDPGVGSSRRSLVVQRDDRYFVAPDNGVLSAVLRDGSARCRMIDLSGLGFVELSATFHGRDLFAPLGALIACGKVSFDDVGPVVEDPVVLEFSLPDHSLSSQVTTVVHVDHFGNIITALPLEGSSGHVVSRVELGGVTVERGVSHYAEGEDGELVFLRGSGGCLEVSRVNGDASAFLGISVGERVEVIY